MPFHISLHPIQSPFSYRPDELDRRFSPLGLFIPPRPPLDNDDLMAFHHIQEARLFFEMSRATFATENTDSLLDPLESTSLKAIAIITGTREGRFPRARLINGRQPWLPDPSPAGRLQRMPAQCRESSRHDPSQIEGYQAAAMACSDSWGNSSLTK